MRTCRPDQCSHAPPGESVRWKAKITGGNRPACKGLRVETTDLNSLSTRFNSID